ncbi:MAG: hypothetical protein ACQESE_01740 [Nanobdellota archaeon]
MAHQKTWFERLDYTYNPFTIKPGFFDDEVIGYDKEIDSIIKMINDGEIIYLEGDFGQGKTTILTYIINEFSGKNKIARIHRSRKDRAFNYEKLLIGANGALKKSFGVKAKNVILIVDEANTMNAKDCSKIEKYYEDGHFKAVLFMDSAFADSPISESLKEKIGENIISLKKLSQNDAIALVRSRLEGGEELVSDDAIKKVYEKSFKNTRRFLENMEDVCRNAVENDRDSVTEKDITVIS